MKYLSHYEMPFRLQELFRQNFLQRMIRASQNLAVLAPIPTAQWMEQHLVLPSSVTTITGPYRFEYAPYLRGIVAAFDDPDVAEVVCQKPAQIGYTHAVLGYLGRIIDRDPGAIIMLFSDASAAREFVDEKLEPIAKESARLSDALDLDNRKKTRSRVLFQRFSGGFLKLGGSRSMRTLKSTPARIVVVEEPDDAEKNLKQQGDAIQLLYQRVKRAQRSKRIIGGTPSVQGISRVEAHLKASDQCVLPIRCHCCEQSHVLDMENVFWGHGETVDPEYGTARPETAVYRCPICKANWSDSQRQANIRDTISQAVDAGDPLCGWVPTANFHGSRGFHRLSELYVCFPGSNLADLVKAHLTAEKRANEGDETARIVFVNSHLGKPYKYRAKDQVTEETLRPAEDYPELEIPEGGLVVTCGIDVQHDRLAIIKRAWGPGAESWLLLWTEILAKGTTIDPKDPVWNDLTDLIYAPVPSVAGWSTRPDAVTIDSGDGYTTDAVYTWVRSMQMRYRGVKTMAGKGSSDATKEVFSLPQRSIDTRSTHARHTKADKYGLQIYIVGVARAKDWIFGKLKLLGEGAGRWHWYKTVRTDYKEQLLSESKVPNARSEGLSWTLLPGRKNEALDSEVYALHAARSQRVHILPKRAWARILSKRQQLPLELPSEAADIETSESDLGSILAGLK